MDIQVNQNYLGEYEAIEGDYDLDCVIGYGKTPLEAIVDLLDRQEG